MLFRSQNDRRALKMVYELGHPDANSEGYVAYPDINVVEEMTNMLSAMRAYEANVSTCVNLNILSINKSTS